MRWIKGDKSSRHRSTQPLASQFCDLVVDTELLVKKEDLL